MIIRLYTLLKFTHFIKGREYEIHGNLFFGFCSQIVILNL